MDADDARRHWDERYRRFPHAFDGKPPEPVRRFADRLRELGGDAARVLVLADGSGRDSVFFAQRGFRATAVEISPVAVGLARERARAAGVNVDLICADAVAWAEDLPAAVRFDAVLSWFGHLGEDGNARVAHALRAHLDASAPVLVVTATAVDERARLAANWPGATVERARGRLLCRR